MFLIHKNNSRDINCENDCNTYSSCCCIISRLSDMPLFVLFCPTESIGTGLCKMSREKANILQLLFLSIRKGLLYFAPGGGVSMSSASIDETVTS